MNEFDASRRDVLKGAGVGLLSLAGFSASSVPAAAHEKIDMPATDLLGPIQVPANSETGFNYPYYLYLPEVVQENVPMLVEPNNTGSPSDDLEEHRSSVENRLADGLGPQLYSKALVVPLLVPVFPRPAGEIAPSGTYTHALDEDSVELEGTDLERVDLQLVKMIKHAKGLLDDLSYPVADDVIMNGFSASGNFVNRFAALHPEMIRSLSAGGINGTPILPLERAKGNKLDYPIGVADLEEITGEPFDTASWRDVSQFLYLGGEDENDTIPYDDAWSDRHQRVAVDVYGEDMQAERMPYSETVYEDAGADAMFKVYEGVGHTPVPLQIQQDIASFHRRNAELKQVTFSEVPEVGDTTLHFDTFVFDNQDLQLRIRSAERGDITEIPASVPTNEEATPMVSLSSAIEENEEITGIILPTDTTNPDNAVASVRRLVKSLPLLSVVDISAGSAPSITLDYSTSSNYKTESQLHMYISDDEGGRQLLTTFRPGTSEVGTYDLSSEELNVPLEVGSEFSVTVVDIDEESTLTSTSAVIENGGGRTSSDVASVTFSSQPTDDQESLEVTHSIVDGYEPTGAQTLQAEIGEDTNILLRVPIPGKETTETVSVEKIPMVAGSDITLKIVDEKTLASDGTVVLRGTEGDVSVAYSSIPTDSNQSATVTYNITESYEPRDALTLRVYDGTLQGSDPGEPLALLSPGDSGTETFTIGEDTDADIDNPVVAILDDVPLARATTADVADQHDENSQTGDDDKADSQQEETDQNNEDQQKSTDEQTSGSEETNDTPEVSEDNSDSDSSDSSGPGFSVGSAIAGIGGLTYFTRRKLNDDSSKRDLSDDSD